MRTCNFSSAAAPAPTSLRYRTELLVAVSSLRSPKRGSARPKGLTHLSRAHPGRRPERTKGAKVIHNMGGKRNTPCANVTAAYESANPGSTGLAGTGRTSSGGGGPGASVTSAWATAVDGCTGASRLGT